jgi:hypothetical protein
MQILGFWVFQPGNKKNWKSILKKALYRFVANFMGYPNIILVFENFRQNFPNISSTSHIPIFQVNQVVEVEGKIFPAADCD